MKAKSTTAARVQTIRRQRGLDSAALAKLMRERGHTTWTANTIVNIENGRKKKWTEDEQCDLADVLEASLFDLFPSLRQASLTRSALSCFTLITSMRSRTCAPAGIHEQQDITADTPMAA